MLADKAFDRCHTMEDRLSRFLAIKIGRNSAESVMSHLRDKYQSELAAANRELRSRS